MPTTHVRIRAYAPGRWSRLLFAAALVAVALAAGSLGFTRPAQAATITVDTTTDEYDTGPNCSLREAIQAANSDTAFGGCAAGSGADTITLPSGTYQITIDPGPDENVNAAGDFDITTSITIQGAGAGSTFVDGRGLDRVFDVAPNGGLAITVGFSGITMENGKGLGTNFGVGGAMFINNNATVTIGSSTLANNQSANGTGGAIFNVGTLTLNTVTLQNNTAYAMGGAINNIGALTVINSTFTGNKAERGGALHINTDSNKTASITGSTFNGNQAVATAGGVSDDGGAIAIDTDGTVNITKSTFTGNSTAANGGAIYFNDSATQAAVATLTMSYNRIAGNTAAAGSGLFYASGTATAERNWWGCNSGPAAAPCDLVSGAADFTPWIRLSHFANPSTVGTGQAATLTADFLRNSDGSPNGAGDLGALAGVPVSFGSAVLGTISAAQVTIQANGAATATYTAGATPGSGSASATVDGATVTANLTILLSDTTPPDVTINQASDQADPTSASPIHFTIVFNEPVTGFGATGGIVLYGTTGATFGGLAEIAPHDGTTYDLSVVGMTRDGTITAGVLANAATDAAGNRNTASTSTDNTVTYIANRAPTAVADSYSTNEDTTLTVAAPGVLGNDTDPDIGDTLSAVLVGGTSHGTLTLSADGSFSYVPSLDYNGADSFSYKARDADGAESAPVTVSITVNAVNDPPTVIVALGGACSSSGVSGTINLVVGDVDSPLSGVTLTGSSSNTKLVPTGNVVLGGSNPNRTLTITVVPQKGSQSAEIAVTAKDSSGAAATVRITALAGTDKNETLTGTSGADLMFGLNGRNTLNGLGGNDLLCGGNADDTLKGGEGADTLVGNRGNDKLYGEGGDDILTGSSGADFFSGGPGTDVATDFNPSQCDKQDGTLETLSASVAAAAAEPDTDVPEIVDQVFLPAVQH